MPVRNGQKTDFLNVPDETRAAGRRRKSQYLMQTPEQKKRAALLLRESQRTVMFARGRSARGQMKSPSIAQRGEGGARGGSGELVLLSETNQGAA